MKLKSNIWINPLDNNKGIALAIVLILAAISLAIMAALVFMLTAGTQVSGIQKRYKTALQAGSAGADAALQMIAARGNLSWVTLTSNINDQTSCINYKLSSATASWPASCSSTTTIDPSLQTSYDMVFDVGVSPVFRVYAKITDTIDGNSSGDLGLVKSGVVNANSGEVAVVAKPYLYTIEVDAENRDNPGERAKYSVLYQY